MLIACQIQRLREAARAFSNPESFGFAILISLGTWISVLAPRVMAAGVSTAAILSLAGYCWARRALKFPRMEWSTWIVWALIVVLVGVSALWIGDLDEGLERTSKIAASLGFAVLLFYLAAELPESVRVPLRRLFVFSFCFGLALIAINMLTGSGLYRLVASKKALDVASESSNRAAVVLSVFLWPCVLAAWQSGTRNLLRLLVLPVAALLITILTESQSAQVATGVGIVILISATILPRITLAVAFVGGVAVLLGMPFFLATACPELLRPGIGWHEASVGARLEIWCAIGKGVFDAPLIGHGVEAVRYVREWGLAHLYFPDRTILHPHNAALQVWYELGLIGAALMAAIWVATVNRIARLPAEMRAICLASALSILLIACISHGLWQSWWLGTLGILPALFRMAMPRDPADF